MRRRLTQQRMTLSDPEWWFRASRAISAASELLLVVMNVCAYLWFKIRNILSTKRQQTNNKLYKWTYFSSVTAKVITENRNDDTDNDKHFK